MRNLRWLVVVGLVVVSGCPVATAAGLQLQGWGRVGVVGGGGGGGADLVCPSPSFCVAFGAPGAVVTSSEPARPSSWKAAVVDPGQILRGLACPSTRLCVVVDASGDVLTSTDPAGGAGGWSSTPVASATGLSDVSCPTVSLCVAVGGGDVAFSTDPGAGGGSWQLIANVVSGLTGPECGKYGGTSGCYGPDLVSVSCPSASVCLAFDLLGGEVVSHDPGSLAGWPASPYGGGQDDDVGPTVCPSARLCVSTCTAGFGLSGAECPGSTYGAGVVVLSPVAAEAIAPDPIVYLWCPSVSLCFAADQTGHLYATTAPMDTAEPWPVLYSALPPASTQEGVINGVACPTVTLCVAFESNGNLIDGLPPATSAKMNAALLEAVTATRNRSVVGGLLSNRGYRETFRATAPGRLRISWYKHATNDIVAGGVVTFARPATRVIKISATRRNAHVLSATHRVILTEVATFEPLVGKAMTARRTIRL